MIRKLLPLFITVFTINISFSQTDCSNGMAGEYPCKDYDLMSHIPVSTLANTSGNPEGSDIWGWTDPLDGKEYAIVGKRLIEKWQVWWAQTFVCSLVCFQQSL